MTASQLTPAEMRETAKRLRRRLEVSGGTYGDRSDLRASIDALNRLAGIIDRDDEVGEDEGWHIGGAWGDYGEVVVPLRILSYVIEGEFVGEDFDRMIEAVRAEEREKAAQIAEEFDPVEAALAGRYAGKDIAARIREQGKEQGS